MQQAGSTIVPGVTTRTTSRGNKPLVGWSPDLLADRDVIAFSNQARKGNFRRHGRVLPRHRDAHALGDIARCQDDIELARCSFGVAVEGLVKGRPIERRGWCRDTVF